MGDKIIKKPTMNDVAKLAGVSQATVSNVINNKNIVSDYAIKKVYDSIRKLEYVPDAIAKSLKQKTSDVIGLIVPDIESGFYSEIAKIVEGYLQSNNFLTYLCNTFYDPILENKLIMNLRGHNVAGIIICYGLINQNIYDQLAFSNIPCVVMDDKVYSEIGSISSIEVDNIKGSKLAINYLHKIGAKKISFASEPLVTKTLKNRFQGFKIAMGENNYPLSDDLIFIENIEYDKLEMGHNLAEKILLEKDIDAIFASSDSLAIGIIKRLQEKNIGIPDDVLIIGFDNIKLSKLFSPSLTTIAQPLHTMATKSAEIILKKIKGETKNEDKLHFILDPSIIIRQSTNIRKK